MLVLPTDAMAMAIFMFEGANQCKPTVLNIRNNNPGNLRPINGDTTTPQDDKGYRTFTSFIDGWQHLIADLHYKIYNHPELITMLDLFNKYAPAGDHNNPTLYTNFVCNWMSKALGYSITSDDLITNIFKKGT
jgi:hypothetical protein